MEPEVLCDGLMDACVEEDALDMEVSDIDPERLKTCLLTWAKEDPKMFARIAAEVIAETIE